MTFLKQLIYIWYFYISKLKKVLTFNINNEYL